MKYVEFWTALLAVTLIGLFALPSRTAVAAANDSAAELYRIRCAVCHGGNGDANTPMARKENIPAFTSEAVRNLSTAEVEDFILFGGKERKASHTYFYKGVTREQGSQLAGFVKQLGNKK